METIACPFCDGPDHVRETSENGYSLVRCRSCRLLFVNPRPTLETIDEAAKTGLHATERGSLTVVGRFDPNKVRFYRRRVLALFGPDALAGKEIRWLDVGAGYGELVEAVGKLVADPKKVCGIEPCIPKQQSALQRGLHVRNCSMTELDSMFDVVSMINVFSHIPDPRDFLASVAGLIMPGGSLMLVTGNGADIPVADLPLPLDLPDHLVFAGRRHLEGFLADAGFRVAKVDAYTEFMPENRLVRTTKNVVKRLIGRPPRTMRSGGAFRSLFLHAVKE